MLNRWSAAGVAAFPVINSGNSSMMLSRYLNIVDKKVTPILYVRLKKALSGLLRSSLLFYRKLCGKLEEYGFKTNTYDPCVGNKMVTTETVVPVIDKKGRIIQNKNGSKRCAK